MGGDTNKKLSESKLNFLGVIIFLSIYTIYAPDRLTISCCVLYRHARATLDNVPT